MAQPVPFHDPKAPFRPQQRQRPAAHQLSPAFGYGGNAGPIPGPAVGGAPQFHSQPQPQAHRRPQPHQFHQAPQPQSQPFYAGGGAGASSDGFYTPQPTHEFRQPQPGSQGFQTPHQGFQQPQQQHAPQAANFGNFGGNQSFQSPPGSHGGGNGQPQQRMHPHQQQPQQPDFINQISANPMAGLAMNTAQDFLQKQSAMYLPGAYGVWGSLKYYFTVNNSYVKSRLKILLFPFWHKNWRRIGSSESDANKPTQYAPPTLDINAPDLYIPLMGFLTYILIVGYSKGTSNQFSPDVIGKDASYCLVMQLVEIGVLAACLYLLNSSIAFWDLVSFSGYKYIPLVIDTVVYQLAGPIAYYVVLLYTGVAVSFFTLNCMKGSVAEPTPENRAFRNYLLFGVSCLQLVLVCWISYTTAPRE